MAQRKTLSKKLRFEVFKRDKFTCQYCGRAAPDVVLEVDHIQPVAKDGDNDILNLVTSCRECNAGKGARELSDDTAIAKRKQQLDELQERREQLDLLLEWQRGLTDLHDETLAKLAGFWGDLTLGYLPTDVGMKDLRALLRKFSVEEITDAMKGAEKYLEPGEDGCYTANSANKAWSYVGRICTVTQRSRGKPYMRDLYYIRGIMRKRFSFCDEWRAIQMLEHAHLAGVEIEELRGLVLAARSWTEWREGLMKAVELMGGEGYHGEAA
jgi:hypothetical protein